MATAATSLSLGSIGRLALIFSFGGGGVVTPFRAGAGALLKRFDPASAMSNQLQHTSQKTTRTLKLLIIVCHSALAQPCDMLQLGKFY